MNLSESLAYLRDTINSINVVNEAFTGGHAPHLEDSVFLGGTQGVADAINSVNTTIKKPQTATIKWDGYPALIFGHGPDGKFSISDKHMFNKADGSGRAIYSPAQFIEYDRLRGVERSGLAAIIPAIWPGLAKASKGTTGYYWGDLLFSQPLEDQNGYYVFKANPKGITYTVDANSQIGQQLAGKVAGIAVHQYIKPDAPAKAEKMSAKGQKVHPTDFAVSLNGKLGGLKEDSDVAILPSKLPQTPKIALPEAELKEVNAKISKYGKALDKFLNTDYLGIPSDGFKNNMLGVYFNNRIREGNLNDLTDGFYKFIENRPMSGVMKQKLLTGYVDKKTGKQYPGHIPANPAGVQALMEIWSSVYKLKTAILNQLNQAAESSPVQGALDDGTKGQEGFVANGYKYVDRMGFSRQNFGIK
jgi:hypothetical protein